MDQHAIEQVLSTISLPAIRYLNSIDSTNEEALRWIDNAAPHLALVIADQQTAGRGRLQRSWVTTPGASLAFSLVFRFPPLDENLLYRLNGLGAIAVQSTLHNKYHLPAHIKWPNDVLIGDKKVCGVLVETRWRGPTLRASVLGIGINIAPQSINGMNLPPGSFGFPVTCVESELGHALDRLELLHDLLAELVSTWLPRLSLPEFTRQWEENLAFRGEWVELWEGTPATRSPRAIETAPVAAVRGRLVGLTQAGELKLIDQDGNPFTVAVGELHLRPGYES